MILLASMAEVEAEDIGAGFEQRENAFPAAACRSERGYDLGFALPSHVDSSRRAGRAVAGACPRHTC
jgi:hypothetical protein